MKGGTTLAIKYGGAEGILMISSHELKPAMTVSGANYTKEDELDMMECFSRVNDTRAITQSPYS